MKKFFVYLLCILTLCSAFLQPLCLSAAAAETLRQHDLFVSPDGSDANPGTKSLPLATIKAAKEKLKTLKVNTDEAVTVWLRGGTYYFDSALNFTSKDLPNVSFKAYDNEAVKISGATEISGFSESTVNGVRAFIKQLDTSSEGWQFNTLYHAERKIHTPRYPEAGAFTVVSVDANDNLFTLENTYWEAGLGNTSFNGSLDEIKLEFGSVTDAYVRVVHRWLDEISHVKYYEPDTGKVGLGRPASAVIEPGDEYWFENVFEALDSEGEWYLNSSTGMLFYIPFTGESASDLTLYAGATEFLIDINGVDGISFEGISFCNTEWSLTVQDNPGLMGEYNIDELQASTDCTAAINIQHADSIVFNRCDFVNIGNSAIKLRRDVHCSSITNCFFDNIGSTGIAIYGDFIAEDAANSDELIRDITVSNNLIQAYGRNTYESIGIHLMYAADCEISHNEIHDGYYTGISCGWQWGFMYQPTQNIKIADNLIYDIGQGWLGDLGGIYTLGVQRGTVISGNVIANVRCGTAATSYGGNGIYTDAGSSYYTIENNLVYDCSANGINIGNCNKDHIVRNNICAFNAQSQFHPGMGNDFYSDAVYNPCTLTNNILLSSSSPILLDINEGLFAESNNLFWDTERGCRIFFNKGYDGHFENAKRFGVLSARLNGYLADDVIADPLFVDAQARNFKLREDSPAFALGFVAWDIDTAGTLEGSSLGASKISGGQTSTSIIRDTSSYRVSGSNYYQHQWTLFKKYWTDAFYWWVDVIKSLFE